MKIAVRCPACALVGVNVSAKANVLVIVNLFLGQGLLAMNAKAAMIRIGVGAPYKGGDLIKHVMGPISDLGREAALWGAKAAEDWAVNGIEHAMNNFNKKAGKA